MVSNRLTDVQIDMLAGEAIVEVAELYHDNAITVRLGATRFELSKGGIYRFDAKPARLRVYSGEAVCETGDKTETLRAGHEMAQLGDEWKTARFDVKSDDPLYRWSAQRSESVAVANVSGVSVAHGNYVGMFGNPEISPDPGFLSLDPDRDVTHRGIFYRNSVNGGYLVPFETDTRLVEEIKTGDELVIDIKAGTLTNVSKGNSANGPSGTTISR